MKKSIIALVAGAFLLSCTPKGGYTINGNVEGLDSSVYLLSEYGDTLQSAPIKNNKFKLSGDATKPGIGYLSDDLEVFTMLFLESGKIAVTGSVDTPDGIKVSGTVSNDRNSEFSTVRHQLVERYYSSDNEDERNSIMTEDEANSIAAIDANLDNYFGLHTLTEMTYGWSGQQTLDKLAQFSPEMQSTKLYDELKEKAEAQKRTDIGQPYIEISLPDETGQTINLSSLIGPSKYVLIDFWASWCPPCMEEIPYLVDAYKKYSKSGFEIFGVSRDQRTSDWRNATKQNGMVWPQVIASGEEGSKVANDYSVFMIPTNYLIGPDGTILAKNLRGKDIELKLSELIGN